MKKLLYLLAATFIFAAAGCEPSGGLDDTDNPDNQGNDNGGVTINGITWATRNVGDKGMFVDKPEDYGEFYTFDEAKTVCPTGWHTPTLTEFQNLANSGSVWISVNGVNGRRFGNGNNTIFLPAAGYRYYGTGQVVGQNTYGFYWSSTSHSATDGGPLYFSATFVSPLSYSPYASGFGVRCVRQ
jgi:uncharacterized protein (TIGR02145 family)